MNKDIEKAANEIYNRLYVKSNPIKKDFNFLMLGISIISLLFCSICAYVTFK